MISGMMNVDIALFTSCTPRFYSPGLSESDMAQCDVMLGIPTHSKFGSLNVAAAVQLIAYDWRMAIGWDE